MDTIKAVVQKIIPSGEHGPYAVATSDHLKGSVTFSLEPTVWEEDEWPEEGTMVFLGKLRKKRAGWRAKYGRFLKPSDEQTERSNKMQFLYPTSRQFPVDEVCEQIVRELEKRNWKIPGIEVEFHEYGSGEQKFRNVNRIKSKDFQLWFCREQGRIPDTHRNDFAAVTEIVIPEKELRIYDDESGPNFYLYVGDDYESDRERFMNGSKVDSKLYGEPKTYLEYTGSFDLRRRTRYSNRRPSLLVHTNNSGRQYDPEGEEPKSFRTDEVMEEFKKYLEEAVLGMINTIPIPSEKIDIFAIESIPVPESVRELFCFGNRDDEERIEQGKEDIEKLDPSERYGLSGGSYRLLSLDISNDGTIPSIAYDGFLWCGIGKIDTETSISKEASIRSLNIPGHCRWTDRENCVFRLKLNRANGVYIADHGQYEKRRKELADAMEKDRDRFTNAEYADFCRARARTIIPVSEYKGDFEQPVVLIKRELSLEEVEIVNGPLWAIEI